MPRKRTGKTFNRLVRHAGCDSAVCAKRSAEKRRPARTESTRMLCDDPDRRPSNRHDANRRFGQQQADQHGQSGQCIQQGAIWTIVARARWCRIRGVGIACQLHMLQTGQRAQFNPASLWMRRLCMDPADARQQRKQQRGDQGQLQHDVLEGSRAHRTSLYRMGCAPIDMTSCNPDHIKTPAEAGVFSCVTGRHDNR